MKRRLSENGEDNAKRVKAVDSTASDPSVDSENGENQERGAAETPVESSTEVDRSVAESKPNTTQPPQESPENAEASNEVGTVEDTKNLRCVSNEVPVEGAETPTTETQDTHKDRKGHDSPNTNSNEGPKEQTGHNEEPVDEVKEPLQGAEKDPKEQPEEVTTTNESSEPQDKEAKKAIGGFGAFSTGSGFVAGGFSAFSSTSGFGGFSKKTNDDPNSSTKESKKLSEKREQDKISDKSCTGTGLDKEREAVTGEENEHVVFATRVKMYVVRLDGTEPKTWKERGTGSLKINANEDDTKSRLVMRADGVLRVAVNLPLVKNTTVQRGLKSSLASEKFVRVSGIEDGHASQFAFKCANDEAAENLFEALKNSLPSDGE